MNIQNCIRSEYVIISNALLSFVWRVAPPIKEGSRLGSLVSHIYNISYLFLNNNSFIQNGTHNIIQKVIILYIHFLYNITSCSMGTHII